jgi:signal transduction histidine kinase
MPDVDDGTLEYIEIVGREAYRAKEITERLLRFGRQEATRVHPVWLAHELSEVISMLESEARKSGLRFEIAVPESLPPVAWDPGECRQVFFNLLRNALHASPRGAAILVTAGEEDGGVAVRVRDLGPGLAEEDLDRIFEPFFTTKPTGQRTGLGLAICERILSFRGGRIWAGNHGEGAELGFWLPRAE